MPSMLKNLLMSQQAGAPPRGPNRTYTGETLLTGVRPPPTPMTGTPKGPLVIPPAPLAPGATPIKRRTLMGGT